MSLRDRLRAFCVGSMLGTVCGWIVFSTLVLALPYADATQRLVLTLVSTAIGAAIAGCVYGSIRSVASLTIGCCMTIHLYDPVFGPGAIPPTGLFTATVLVSFIAAYLGHRLPFMLLAGLARCTSKEDACE